MPNRKRFSGMENAPLKLDFKTSLRLIFNRNFNLVLIINLIVMIIFFLVVVTGADYVLKQYGASLSVAGLSSGTTVLGCLAGRLLGGCFFSIAGGKKLLLYGLFTFCLSFALAIMTDSLAGIFLARFASGIGAGLSIAANETIATLSVPNECKGLGISIFSYSVVLGLALGPFFGILLTGGISYRSMMTALLLAAMPLWIGAIFLKNVAGAHKVHRGMLDLYAYIDPRVIPFSLLIMFIFMGYGCIQVYITPYAAQRGLTDSASVFFLIYGISAVASRPFTGRLFDAGKLNAIMWPLFAITIAGLLLLAWAKSGAALILAGALCGIGYGNLQSVGQAVAVRMVTPSRYAQATSTFFNLMNVGIGFGPYLFGYVAAPFGYAAMFSLLAATVFAAAIPYYFLRSRI